MIKNINMSFFSPTHRSSDGPEDDAAPDSTTTDELAEKLKVGG